MVQGEQFNQTVNGIVNMGFPKEDVVRALRAAFNNPDRAVEYLINVCL
jgi:UV excision repair protein RAD23